MRITNTQEMFAQFHNCWSEINAAYASYAKRMGISYSALEVLCEIYHADFALTQRKICEKTHLPKTTVNTIVSSLVKQGYVELKEMEDDRRQKGVCLTDAGFHYAKPMMDHMSRSEMMAFEELDEAVMQTMISGISTYQKNFNELLNQTKGGSDDGKF